MKLVIIVSKARSDLSAMAMIAYEATQKGVDVTFSSPELASEICVKEKPDAVLVSGSYTQIADFLPKLAAQGVAIYLKMRLGQLADFSQETKLRERAQKIRQTILPDIVSGWLCNGKLQYDVMRSEGGIPADRLHCVGSLSHDCVSPKWRKLLSYKQSDHILLCGSFLLANAVSESETRKEINRLQTMGLVQSEQAITEQQYQFDRFLETVQKLCADFPNEKFVVRPHPREKLERYQQTLGSVKNCTIDQNSPVYYALKDAKLVLHANSRIALDALMLDVHPICLDYLNTPSLCLLDSLPAQLSFGAADYADLKHTIQNIDMLVTSVDLRAQYRNHVSTWLTWPDGLAAQRTVEAILEGAAQPKQLLVPKDIYQEAQKIGSVSEKLKQFLSSVDQVAGQKLAFSAQDIQKQIAVLSHLYPIKMPKLETLSENGDVIGVHLATAYQDALAVKPQKALVAPSAQTFYQTAEEEAVKPASAHAQMTRARSLIAEEEKETPSARSQQTPETAFAMPDKSHGGKEEVSSPETPWVKLDGLGQNSVTQAKERARQKLEEHRERLQHQRALKEQKEREEAAEKRRKEQEEKARLAEKRAQEQAQLEAIKRQKEQEERERMAEENRRREVEARARAEQEKARLAEEKKLQEERRQLEESHAQHLAEQERLLEEQRLRQELIFKEEQRKLEEARKQFERDAERMLAEKLALFEQEKQEKEKESAEKLAALAERELQIIEEKRLQEAERLKAEKRVKELQDQLQFEQQQAEILQNRSVEQQKKREEELARQAQQKQKQREKELLAEKEQQEFELRQAEKRAKELEASLLREKQQAEILRREETRKLQEKEKAETAEKLKRQKQREQKLLAERQLQEKRRIEAERKAQELEDKLAREKQQAKLRFKEEERRRRREAEEEAQAFATRQAERERLLKEEQNRQEQERAQAELRAQELQDILEKERLREKEILEEKKREELERQKAEERAQALEKQLEEEKKRAAELLEQEKKKLEAQQKEILEKERASLEQKLREKAKAERATQETVKVRSTEKGTTAVSASEAAVEKAQREERAMVASLDHRQRRQAAWLEKMKGGAGISADKGEHLPDLKLDEPDIFTRAVEQARQTKEPVAVDAPVSVTPEVPKEPEQAVEQTDYFDQSEKHSSPARKEPYLERESEEPKKVAFAKVEKQGKSMFEALNDVVARTKAAYSHKKDGASVGANGQEEPKISSEFDGFETHREKPVLTTEELDKFSGLDVSGIRKRRRQPFVMPKEMTRTERNQRILKDVLSEMFPEMDADKAIAEDPESQEQ